VADLTFSQPAKRNLAVPISIAVAVLIIAAVAIFRFTPRSTADVSITKTAVHAAHLVFKSESTIVGSDRSQDDLYVLVTLHIEDHLHLPLFLKDFTASLTPSNPDGTPAEDLTSSAIEKPEIPNLYLSFPAVKALADQQGSPLLLRETKIDPGQSTEGFLLLHFPASQATWDARKTAAVTINFYHQQPMTIEIPKQPAK
jgi:hypothetical protein